MNECHALATAVAEETIAAMTVLALIVALASGLLGYLIGNDRAIEGEKA